MSNLDSSTLSFSQDLVSASNEAAIATSNTASVTKLPNGLTVIHQPMVSPAVAIDVWVEAGASKEPMAQAGMAHFLEHMVFKGTQHLQPGEFDWAVESRGGISNAATSHDYAHFYITVAAQAVPATLPYLAELVLGAAIPDQEFEPERKVVLEEIRQANDDPDWVGYQALCHLLYGHHAYGRPVLGTPETLASFSPQAMRQFHQAYYQPQNMTVAIAGNLPKDQAIALVQKSFNHFPAPSQSPQPKSIAPNPLSNPQPPQRQTLRLPHLEQSRLTLAWIGPGIHDLSAACHLDLLATILGVGRSSRLVRELREEKQLVQEIDTDFSLQRDCGEFSLTIWLDRENLETVERIVRDRITTLRTQPVTPVELARAQRLLLNDHAFGAETPSQIAGRYGYYATLASPELVQAYPLNIQAATPYAIQQTAQQYLDPKAYTAVILEPA